MGLPQSGLDLKIGQRVAEIRPDYSSESIQAYEHVIPHRANFHDDADAAKKLGFSQPFASGGMILGHIIEALLLPIFGEGWSHGGALNCANIMPIVAGADIVLAADVIGLLPEGDKTRVLMNVTARLPDGTDLIACTASAFASAV